MLDKSNVLLFDNFIKIKNIADNTQNEVLKDHMNKAQIELIKELHPYTIRELKEDGRWQTYVKDASKKSGRKEIKAPTEEALYKRLGEVYLIGDKFEEVFHNWLDYISGYGKAGGTIQRHEQRYKKYLAGSKIPSMLIRNINLLSLEEECNRIVSDFDLSYHDWQQVKTILIGTFKYAIKKNMIFENPMDKIEIGVRYRQTVKKSSETQVYRSNEYDDLMQYLEAKYTETEDDSFLAIKFGLFTGLRAGELSALQFGDVEGNKLHVVREEVRKKSKEKGFWVSTCTVVPHTKTYSDRLVTLLPKAEEILKRLRDKYPDHTDSDFLFTRNGERLRERQLAYVLEKYSERNGKRTKSTHKMRKTYASRLNANGVPIEQIRVELGHRYLKSTLDYIYNPLTDDETYDLMAQAL